MRFVLKQSLSVQFFSLSASSSLHTAIKSQYTIIMVTTRSQAMAARPVTRARAKEAKIIIKEEPATKSKGAGVSKNKKKATPNRRQRVDTIAAVAQAQQNAHDNAGANADLTINDTINVNPSVNANGDADVEADLAALRTTIAQQATEIEHLRANVTNDEATNANPTNADATGADAEDNVAALHDKIAHKEKEIQDHIREREWVFAKVQWLANRDADARDDRAKESWIAMRELVRRSNTFHEFHMNLMNLDALVDYGVEALGPQDRDVAFRRSAYEHFNEKNGPRY